jgi:hypothetical protein
VLTAKANADALAQVGSGANLTSSAGTVEVSAYNSNDALAVAFNLSASLGLAIGAASARPTNGSTTADLGGGRCHIAAGAGERDQSCRCRDRRARGRGHFRNGAVNTARERNVTASPAAPSRATSTSTAMSSSRAVGRAPMRTFGASFSALFVGVMVANAEVNPYHQPDHRHH